MEKLEAKYTGIGSCLRVPSVQDLAGVPMATIPPRYIRPDQDPPIISDASSFPIVPVIDLQNFLSSDLMTSELDTLHFACKEWGFFQLSMYMYLKMSKKEQLIYQKSLKLLFFQVCKPLLDYNNVS
ncbi:Thebaine 6-O-demethylase [Bertholletia excelsa]